MTENLSYAYGGPPGAALLKTSVDDFCVTELLGFEPSGSGEHVFMCVQKRNLNTHEALARLARFARVRPRQLGYCGLKDKTAVAQQWFSVHLPGAAEPDWSGLEDQHLQVLAVARHRRKLRIGAHQGNRFSIRLRSVSGSADRLQQRCLIVAEQGFPNYFGAQRFGHNSGNIDAARRFFAQPVGLNHRPSRRQKLYISAARSYLFNMLAAARVADGSWRLPIQGDVFQLEGCGSLFSEPISESIADRLAKLDLHITGPLWGAGDLLSSAAAALRERRIAAQHPDFAAGLAALGLRQQRRALRARAKHFRWEFRGRDMLLQFDLSKGCYATSLLRELVATNSRQRE